MARKFAARGDRVALLARGERGLDGAARDIEEAGGIALPIALDVADYQAVQQAAQQVQQALGPIDVWVNNAMTTVFAPFDDIEPPEFARATQVTYLGVVWGTRAAIRRMRPRNRGTVVQVGSALAYRGIPLQAPYCGAKHAIKGFTESVRSELLHDGSGVHVTMVQLPALNTPQFEIGRTKMDRQPRPVPPIYQPEVAAEAIVAITRIATTSAIVMYMENRLWKSSLVLVAATSIVGQSRRRAASATDPRAATARAPPIARRCFDKANWRLRLRASPKRPRVPWSPGTGANRLP